MAFGKIAPLNWSIREQWLELRRELLFEATLDGIHERGERIRGQLATEWQAAGAERREQVAELLAELTLDLRSYLPRWHLLAGPDARTDATARTLVEQQAAANEDLCRSWSASATDLVVRESGELEQSTIRRVSELSDAGVLMNRFGNDSPHDVTGAVRRGAILVTTNPVMVNNARHIEAAHWDPIRERLCSDAQWPTSEQRVMRFNLEVVLAVARELKPIHEASAGRFGHVTYQVNPHRSDAADPMVAEAELVWSWASERMGGDPNVMFKVPGTEAGLAAAARLGDRGIPLTITASCSVAQHLAFAGALEQAEAPCLLTQMNGRLDESVADELDANGIDDATAISRWASTAIVRRSYRMLHDDNRWRNSHLLVASLRGPWNVTGALTRGPEPVFVTAFPDKAAEYERATRDAEVVPAMHQDVPGDVLDVLGKSRRFATAYQADGMATNEFSRHHTVAATLAAFRGAYDELAAYLS